MGRTYGFTLLLGLAVSASTACGTDSARDTIVLRDSVGIRIVENPAPSSADHQLWVLDPTPLLELGAAPNDTTQQFIRVGDALLVDSVLVVSDDIADEVVTFTLEGRFLGYVGRSGRGPGELSDVRGLYRCRGDTLVVIDSHRVSVFDREGRFARSEQVALNTEGRYGRVEGSLFDCSTFLIRTSSRRLPPLGDLGHESTTLMLGALDEASRDTIAIVPTRQIIRHNISGTDQALTLPWGTHTNWAVGREHVYVGISNRLEVRVYNRAGRLVRLIRWSGGFRPVTSADRALFAQKRTHWVEEMPTLGEVLVPLEGFPFIPEQVPAFLSLLVDDQENLWVRDYPRWVAGWPEFYESDLREHQRPDDDPETWTVFDATGRLRARVVVPTDLAVKSVYGGYLLAVWRDAYDVERVRLYRIDKQGRA